MRVAAGRTHGPVFPAVTGTSPHSGHLAALLVWRAAGLGGPAARRWDAAGWFAPAAAGWPPGRPDRPGDHVLASMVPAPAVTRPPRIRFAFRLAEGPAAGLTCGGWRVWTHGESTYITGKPLADTWKVSLHGDDHWAAAVTAENAASRGTVLPAGHDRAMWQFMPTVFKDGRRTAFTIAVFRHAFRPEQPDPKETVLGVPDSWDVLALALVRMAEPGAGPAEDEDLVGGPLSLASGRTVWVARALDRIDPLDPEPVPVSTMIEPVTPEHTASRRPDGSSSASTSGDAS